MQVSCLDAQRFGNEGLFLGPIVMAVLSRDGWAQRSLDPGLTSSVLPPCTLTSTPARMPPHPQGNLFCAWNLFLGQAFWSHFLLLVGHFPLPSCLILCSQLPSFFFLSPLPWEPLGTGGWCWDPQRCPTPALSALSLDSGIPVDSSLQPSSGSSSCSECLSSALWLHGSDPLF